MCISVSSCVSSWEALVGALVFVLGSHSLVKPKSLLLLLPMVLGFPEFSLDE